MGREPPAVAPSLVKVGALVTARARPSGVFVSDDVDIVPPPLEFLSNMAADAGAMPRPVIVDFDPLAVVAALLRKPSIPFDRSAIAGFAPTRGETVGFDAVVTGLGADFGSCTVGVAVRVVVGTRTVGATVGIRTVGITLGACTVGGRTVGTLIVGRVGMVGRTTGTCTVGRGIFTCATAAEARVRAANPNASPTGKYFFIASPPQFDVANAKVEPNFSIRFAVASSFAASGLAPQHTRGMRCLCLGTARMKESRNHRFVGDSSGSSGLIRMRRRA